MQDVYSTPQITLQREYLERAIINIAADVQETKSCQKHPTQAPIISLAMSVARNYNEFLVQEVLRHSGGAAVVMDFGAGTGTFARMLSQRGLNGYLHRTGCIVA